MSVEKGSFSLVIFDLDGTLVDSSLDIALSTLHALHRLGRKEVTLDDLMPFEGAPLEEVFPAFLPLSLLKGGVTIYRRHYARHLLDHTKVFPDVPEMLEAISPVSLAIATTKPSKTARQMLEALDLIHHFSMVQGSDGLPHKPDPAMILRVMERMGASPDRSLVVGDTERDVEAGTSAGAMTCAFVRKPWRSPPRADFIVRDAMEIVPIVFGKKEV